METFQQLQEVFKIICDMHIIAEIFIMLCFFLQSVTNPESSITSMQKTKLLFGLSNSLEDITTIEEVCDADGVSVVAATLNEQNSQMRKYAVVVLAQLALSLKGLFDSISILAICNMFPI